MEQLAQVNQVAPELGWFVAGLIIIAIWSVIWKGIALWKAARLGKKWWFIALLIINTVGIFEIIYIYFIAPRQEREQ